MSEETTKREIAKVAKASEKAAAAATRNKTLQDRQVATSQADKFAAKTERENLRQEASRLGLGRLPTGISTGRLRDAVEDRREEVRQQNAVEDKAKSELKDFIKATVADLNKGGTRTAQDDRNSGIVQTRSFDIPFAPAPMYRPDKASMPDLTAVPISFYAYDSVTKKVGTITLCASTSFIPLLPP